MLDEIVTPDVFTAARTPRGVNAFTRDDGTPLNYTLVNIKDGCKNTFEVVNQLRVDTDNSHHRYQLYAFQHIVQCIAEDNGNGYIWHTTNSGNASQISRTSPWLRFSCPPLLLISLISSYRPVRFRKTKYGSMPLRGTITAHA